ncbi:MAG TPA: MmcQ/YjbR family DNA-binding protein [Solirubrobacteraceae bacterium]|nr:MmcQ/YjbR family DNA-binding protein [Solirubrobacteraceae bacterium]
MASWDDVRQIALSLPDAGERFMHGSRGWHVHNKGFVWERPLRKADLRALGDAAPTGPILGARVEHLQAKEALIADAPNIYFTTPHFDGYPAVLVRLERIPLDELRELIVEAWLSRAPKRLARNYIATHFSDTEQRPAGS